MLNVRSVLFPNQTPQIILSFISDRSSDSHIFLLLHILQLEEFILQKKTAFTVHFKVGEERRREVYIR
jgi:hypothetical protein